VCEFAVVVRGCVWLREDGRGRREDGRGRRMEGGGREGGRRAWGWPLFYTQRAGGVILSTPRHADGERNSPILTGKDPLLLFACGAALGSTWTGWGEGSAWHHVDACQLRCRHRCSPRFTTAPASRRGASLVSVDDDPRCQSRSHQQRRRMGQPGTDRSCKGRWLARCGIAQGAQMKSQLNDSLSSSFVARAEGA